MTTNYTSVKSVLYDISLTLDDRYYNESKIIEWLNKGARLLRTDQMLEGKLAAITLTSHKAQLPSDLKYLVQIAYDDTPCSDSLDDCYPELSLPTNSELSNKFLLGETMKWKPMKLASNPYHMSICLDNSLVQCTQCEHEFSVSTSLILTSTLKEAALLVAYLGLPTDEDGGLLIPDNEEVKEALLHYALYRHWMAKYSMKEDGAEKRMERHLSMWNTLSKKAAGNLNLPDVNEMENLKNQFNRLVPRENQFQKFFLNLNNREDVNF